MNALVVGLVLSAAAGSGDSAPVIQDEGQPWSVVGGRTVGVGHGALEGTVGWPGISVAYLRGVVAPIDVGVRAGFIYGREGLVSAALPGFKVQGLLKVKVLGSGAVALALTFEPGPFFNSERGQTVWGFSLPIGARLGVAASSALTLGISFDIPFWVQFGAGGGMNVPFLPGVGVEYFASSNLLFFARARMGPTLRPARLAEFTLDASIGVGWRM